MVFAETIHSHFSRSSGYDNYYYNRLSKILKYMMSLSLYLAFLELLTSGSSFVKVQLPLLKFISEISPVPIISFVVLIQSLAFYNF